MSPINGQRVQNKNLISVYFEESVRTRQCAKRRPVRSVDAGLRADIDRDGNADVMQKFMQRWLRAEIAIARRRWCCSACCWLWNPSGLYLWLKAFHVIAVIAWMAGMLYLPRLFVYHCEAEIGSKQSETFKVMERRLLRAIINPAMVVTWVLGLWLAWDGGLPQGPAGCMASSCWC